MERSAVSSPARGANLLVETPELVVTAEHKEGWRPPLLLGIKWNILGLKNDVHAVQLETSA